MKPTQATIVAVICWTTTPTTAQDGTFRTWFETPETVVAGETFEVEMWASFEGDLLRPGGWFAGVLTSFEVTGDLEAFDSVSPLTEWLNLLLDGGTPDENVLRDAWTIQLPLPTLDTSNPLHVLTFEINTSDQSTGSLDVQLIPGTDYAEPILGWSVDGVDDYVSTLDPNIALIATPATVRVIPGPAPLGLLVLAGPGVARRRR